jgi:hypothetical protein
VTGLAKAATAQPERPKFFGDVSHSVRGKMTSRELSPHKKADLDAINGRARIGEDGVLIFRDEHPFERRTKEKS